MCCLLRSCKIRNFNSFRNRSSKMDVTKWMLALVLVFGCASQWSLSSGLVDIAFRAVHKFNRVYGIFFCSFFSESLSFDINHLPVLDGPWIAVIHCGWISLTYILGIFSCQFRHWFTTENRMTALQSYVSWRLWNHQLGMFVRAYAHKFCSEASVAYIYSTDTL